MILVQPGTAPVSAVRERPLLRSAGLQQRIAQTGDVEVASTCACTMFAPDRLGRVVGEQALAFGRDPPRQTAREVGGDRPVVAGLAGCSDRRAHAADATFAVGHRAVLLPPAGGRQQQIGERSGRRRGEGLLDDDEFASLQRATHRGLVGHRLCGVGAGDPQGLDRAVGGRLEHLDRGATGRCGHVGHTPECGHLGAVLRVAQVAMRGQQVGHAADLTPAHRIGLTGERERAGSRRSDLSGGQVQVDQRGIPGGAGDALVQTLAVQRKGRRCIAEPACRSDDVVFAQTGLARGLARREFAHAVAQGVEAGGVRGDECGVDEALPQQRVQHAMEQRDVAARQQRQVQVGQVRRLGATRIDNDQLLIGMRTARVLQSAEQDRMCPCGVAAGHEDGAGVVEVLVAGWRGIGAERCLVAGHRARHAQPGIGVDVVGAHQALGQLVEHVVVLGQQLPRAVEAHRIRTVAGDDGGEPRGGLVQRVVPRHRLGRRIALRPPHRGRQACLERHRCACRQVQGCAFGAQSSEVRRVLGVASDTGDAGAVGFDQHAAADAAIGAGGAGFRHGGGLSGTCRAIGAGRGTRPRRGATGYACALRRSALHRWRAWRARRCRGARCRRTRVP